MQSKASTPEEYLDSLPEDRKHAIAAMRKVILQNLPEGFSERIGYGMLCYVVPHSLYPAGYHCDPKLPLSLFCLASQKNYLSLHHMGLYDGKLLDWFKKEWEAVATKKLDMGKCCVRFKKFEDIPLGLIGELVTKLTPQQWIEIYEQNLKRSSRTEK